MTGNAIMDRNATQISAQWEQQLTPLALPVDPRVKDQALRHIQSSAANAKNTAAILSFDPVFCLLLFHHANRSLRTSGNESHGLSHAISLLGFPKVEQLIGQSIEQISGSPYLNEYRQQLSISLHAAHQASSWTQQNPHWPKGALYWASLFYYAPVWALWHHAGEKMVDWQKARAAHQGATHADLEHDLFGTNLSSFCATLSNTWVLPGHCQQAWQQSLSGNAKFWVRLSRIHQQPAAPIPAVLQRFCAKPGFAVALANRLSEEAEWNWGSKRCLRLQYILATALHCSPAQAIALSHQQAANASRHRLHGTLSCAVQLLSYYNKITDCEMALKTSSGKISSDEVQIKSISVQQTCPSLIGTLSDDTSQHFEHVINQLTTRPDSFSNLHDVMNTAVQTLCNSVNLERATISLLNLKTRQIRTLYSSGCDSYPALKNFSHTLSRGDLLVSFKVKTTAFRRSDLSMIL